MYFYGTGWAPVSNKVTNLNIFSSAHSVEVMRQNTKRDKCFADGDYLAWTEMEWTLHGHAVLENIDTEEPCIGEPLVDVYDASDDSNGIQSMELCMQLCENLGTRAPSIRTVKEWTSIQDFFQRYGKPIGATWVAISDEEKEGEWRDYYTGKVMNHTKAWASWAPNKGREENCASLAKSSWGPAVLDDMPCETKQYGCMCKRRPQSFLKLRGLCNDSSIDIYYKPMNNRTDIRKLKLIGLKTTIEHDKRSGLWKLSVVEYNVTGMSKTTQASFTLGRHNWTIIGDRDCNKDISSDSYTTELKGRVS